MSFSDRSRSRRIFSLSIYKFIPLHGFRVDFIKDLFNGTCGLLHPTYAYQLLQVPFRVPGVREVWLPVFFFSVIFCFFIALRNFDRWRPWLFFNPFKLVCDEKNDVE
ncbi:hypothetical protein L6452_44723 [Arctium lappa]|nr:hypothetical protein L6452_44723 [Arctium lappa]